MKRSPGFFFCLHVYLLVCEFLVEARADILINEIYYDHPGTDTGWEYVELCNTGPEPIDLSRCTLEFVDGSTGRARPLWQGAPGPVLQVGERFLLGGADVDGADGILLGSIENGPDAVRLLFGTGQVDLVGYGETVYCEGEPAPDVPSGISLSRKPDGCDTDDNASDLVPADPTPGQQNFFASDLEVIPCEAPLPCAGSPFEVRVLLVNRGLERFTGPIHLHTSMMGSSGERVIDVDMPPSETMEVELEMSFAPPACFDLDICIESSVDENCGNDTASAPICSSPGDLVINEIMYRPLEGGSEWIEIMNRTAVTVSLRDWRLSDATGTRRLISEEDQPIDPGGFIILAQDSILFGRDNPLCTAEVIDPAGGWPWLNDSGEGASADMITLYDPGGRIVERIEYPSLVEVERGRSLERFSPDACSSYPGGLWHRSSEAPGSTPGAPNSGLVPGITRPGRIETAPNPFSPERDGTVRIWGEAVEGETGFSVRVFDIGGVEVVRIFGEEGGARIFSCRWDGRAEGGWDSPTGLYICVVEFTTRGGGVCRRVKRCIALHR